MDAIAIQTNESREVVDITKRVQTLVPKTGEGFLHLYLQHTTAALSVADLDPGTDRDILNALQAIMPDLDFRHPHDPSHTPDHIWSTIIGVSELVPYANGRLQLGTWQHVVLLEFDGPRDRHVAVATCR